MSTEVADENAMSTANRTVQVEGETLAYRRFGNARSDAPPLLCLQHFRGNLDTWDQSG